jgi:hypothetical protein
MLFGLGNKVRFVHTGAEGKIVKMLDDGMFIVLLDGIGIEIPASPEHLERVDQLLSKSSVKGRVVKGKSEHHRPEMPLPQRQYEILSSEGIQIAFEAVSRPDGSTQRYVVYLLNDTQYQALYDLGLSIRGEALKKMNGKLEPESVTKIMEMQADYLSDNPHLVISCRQISTQGMGDWLKKDFKLKPKQFFARRRTAPLLDRPAYVYGLFKPFEEKEALKESLESYTKKNTAPKAPDPQDGLYRKWAGNDVKAYANFPLEKDFHIEKLLAKEEYEKLSNGQILRHQLLVFEDYLDKAIRLGVPRVFVIHGKGRGRLKDEIATRLITNPDVKTFKNEYHPKYGTGATEVIF